jgi:hypothetical protein
MKQNVCTVGIDLAKKIDTAFEAEALLRRGGADCIRARRLTIPSHRGRIYHIPLNLVVGRCQGTPIAA